MPSFLTITEVAKLLRIGERTVHQLVREGRIGGVAKVGNQWLFEEGTLPDWLKRGGETQAVFAWGSASHTRTTASAEDN